MIGSIFFFFLQCFYCSTEESLREVAEALRRRVFDAEGQPLIHCVEESVASSENFEGFETSADCEIEEDFEII